MISNEPLRPSDTRELIREILNTGTVTYSKPHAIERLRERNLSTLDCINVLRAGVVGEGEYQNGGWRYLINTTRISVVIRFETENVLEVVTAWRN